MVNEGALQPNVMEDASEPGIGRDVDQVVGGIGMVNEFIMKKYAIMLQRGSCNEMDAAIEVSLVFE